MIACLLLLTGCTTKNVGNFCDVYVEVDMDSKQATRLDRVYQERILANELYYFDNCWKKFSGSPLQFSS